MFAGRPGPHLCTTIRHYTKTVLMKTRLLTRCLLFIALIAQTACYRKTYLPQETPSAASVAAAPQRGPVPGFCPLQ